MGKQRSHSESEEPHFTKLPGAVKGHFVTRFSPESSGYMDIGHAKACVLNEYYARELDGEFILRFDDTNPTTHKVEYEESIKEDMALLNISVDRITHTSDHFDYMIAAAERLIKEGLAYVDDTPMEQLRYERQNNIESSRRDRSVEENLAIWEEMKDGTDTGRLNCLRAKIEGAKAKNKALADPVIFRVHLTPHETTGDKYKVYPTYDFGCPLADALDGVTHALRTTEFHDRDSQYRWMQTSCGVREVQICDFGRVDFKYTIMSKPVMLYYLSEGLAEGWDDPRMPTVRGAVRGGMTVEALKKFMYLQGSSRNLVNLDWSTVWAMNRKILDRDCARLVALDTAGGVANVRIQNGEKYRNTTDHIPQYRKNEALGTKLVHYHDELIIEARDAAALNTGDEFTLIGWYNGVVVDKQADGTLTIEIRVEGDRRHTVKVNWLAATSPSVPVRIVEYTYLLTKDKIAPDEDFRDFINRNSKTEKVMMCEPHIQTMPKGAHVQMMKHGYYIIDKTLQDDKEIVLIEIPDGHEVPGRRAEAD